MQQTILTCKQGESFERVLRFADRTTKTPKDISGWSFSMDVRASANTAVALSATITTRDQITDRGAADLLVTIPLNCAVRVYKYDLRVVIAEKVKYRLSGDFIVEPSITRA